MLFRLAYYSKNRLRRSHNPKVSPLRDIIQKARLNNRRLGITGGLMFSRNFFGQVLEGEREAVSSLFVRIAQDARHDSVVIMEACETVSRRFEHWSMGQAHSTSTAERLNAEYGFDDGFNPSNLTAERFTAYVFEMVSAEEKLIKVAIPTFDNR
jgi:hypothetical protein